MTPVFSIIIPVYNVAPYLRECLNSVLAAARTLSEKCRVNSEKCGVEIICVDDGSTDESGAILDEYAEKVKSAIPNSSFPVPTSFPIPNSSFSLPNFHVIHQPNRGVSASRNLALDMAKGEWIWFVDGDDTIDCRALTTLTEAISSASGKPLHAVFFEYLLFKDGEPIPRAAGEFERAVYHTSVDAALSDMFFRPASRTLLRRTAIDPVRFKGYRQNEDAVFMMEYLCQGRGWVTTSAPLYMYRFRDGSASHNKMFTAELVNKIFDSENELLSAALRLRDANPGADMTGLFGRLHGRAYHTYCEWYFGLKAKERRRLLPKWIAIQVRYWKLYPWPKARRIRFATVWCLRSGWLVKPIVCRSVPGLAKFRRGVRRCWCGICALTGTKSCHEN